MVLLVSAHCTLGSAPAAQCAASTAANVLWKPEPAAERGRGHLRFWGWILFSANRHYITVRGRRREKTEVKSMAFLSFKKDHWQHLLIFFNCSVTKLAFVHFWESDSFLVYCLGWLSVLKRLRHLLHKNILVSLVQTNCACGSLHCIFFLFGDILISWLLCW